MTIHNIMNASDNISADVEINVYEDRFNACYYSGKYEDCSERIYSMPVVRFEITSYEVKTHRGLVITEMNIYVEG